MQTTNIFAQIPAQLPCELLQPLLGSSAFTLERIVSQGHASAPEHWYDQETHEWVILLQGSAGLVFEGEPAITEMKPGDYLLIPAHVKHRVAWTDPSQDTVWLALHYRDGEPPANKR